MFSHFGRQRLQGCFCSNAQGFPLTGSQHPVVPLQLRGGQFHFSRGLVLLFELGSFSGGVSGIQHPVSSGQRPFKLLFHLLHELLLDSRLKT